MKVLYFGTVCNLDKYEDIMKKSKYYPSVASIVFETAILKGLNENGVDVEIVSYPMIPTFPNCKLLYWGAIKETLVGKYKSTWLCTFNIPIVKQLTRKIHGKYLLNRWLKENKDDECVVLTYSIPPFLGKEIIDICKKYNAKCCAIIPDLLQNMYMNSKSKFIVSSLRKKYLSSTVAIQNEFDGYIYLTETMKEVVGKEKPYIVMEGIANLDDAVSETNEDIKKEKKVIMYAGGLDVKFGILNLVEAFNQLDLNNTELWLFGAGNAIDKIKEYAVKNDRIRYWGNVSRKEILEYEKKASLLVNVRSVNDEFVKYSFPSKTIEYMLSGTPLLTTRLPGIPEEYFDYVFSIMDNSVESIECALKDILQKDETELQQVGHDAKRFISTNKNSKKQGKKIYCFLLNLFTERYT